MREKESTGSNLHKEEMKGRITKDEIDRTVLRNKLHNCIDIFDHVQHSENALVSIVTGKVITDQSVNVYRSAEI